MSDYISRADAIKALEKVHNDAKVWEVKCGVSEALHALEALPSADAVQGEWIMHIDDLFPEESTQECSNCHEHETIMVRNDNYCPNCGARMKGGDDE